MIDVEKKIVIVKTDKYGYPKAAPFRPSVNYPEYSLDALAKEHNHIYDMVREGFRLSGYDACNYGTVQWNPLGHFISKGDHVLLKPNLVMDKNNIMENGTDCLYTQPALAASVIDYVIIALKAEGRIVIGDAPMQECDFDRLIKRSGYKDLIGFYRKKLKSTKIMIDLVDFRGLKSRQVNGINHSVEVPVEGQIIDLKDESEFYGSSEKAFSNMRITNYDPELLKKHHNSRCNEYFVHNYVLDADVVINMPKPKTHRKAGVTISLKNLVGINCRKEYLPHHTNGSIDDGGDEYLNSSWLKKKLDNVLDAKNYLSQTKKAYCRAFFAHCIAKFLLKVSRKIAKDRYYEGSWYGNDTISKTIVDLNKILFYSDKNGILHKERQRRYFIIADMVISGEKEGPVEPSAKDVGIIAMGEDPVCFDEAILKLMGAKKEYIHTMEHARNPKGNLKITERESYPVFISNVIKWDGKRPEDLTDDGLLYFLPAYGWEEAFLNPAQR